jgi:hypothetical protein
MDTKPPIVRRSTSQRSHKRLLSLRGATGLDTLSYILEMARLEADHAAKE